MSVEMSVEDRASGIRITDIEPIPLGVKTYVQIKTNYDVTGWGEVNNLDSSVACAMATSLSELLIGENPTRIEHLWQRMFRGHRNMRAGAYMTHTISAIDMALWDITGKLYGVPVYRLLGGAVRDKIWMYPSPKAIKVGPGGPHYHAGTPMEVEDVVNKIRAAREKVGPDGAVMVDAHSCLPIPFVIQLGSYLKSDDLLFLEEAWVPGNIDTMRRVREAIPVPLATGERDRTIWEVREILEGGVIDVLQPDCGHGGGISQMRKVATLAESHYVPIAPHCTMTYLGLTASLHVAASTAHFLIHEGYDHQTPKGLAHKTWAMDDDGYVSLPEGPGLGVEIDEAVMLEVSKDPSRRFKWPQAFHRDGSVADY
ncbi:MAG: mandelate racemase/muconate lactonizing enzyme family protein [Candidatus Poribacteria bacterium]|nr:mandelate racemase/muconate lactonizing enzyme family protein [Candidatus Poribacteria bacterium]